MKNSALVVPTVAATVAATVVGVAGVVALAIAAALSLPSRAVAADAASAAVTLRVGMRGDIASMDPHGRFEAMQVGLLSNLYEPLVGRGADLKLVPVLATRWSRTTPTVWRFHLREGVRFQGGEALDADDVVFSLQRAAGPDSDLRGQLSLIRQVRRVDAATVDVETVRPTALLPDLISIVGVMDRSWTESHRAAAPTPPRATQPSPLLAVSNGTGPFELASRTPGQGLTLRRWRGWWGPQRGNLDQVALQVLDADATRVAGLLAGDVDLITAVPLQDIDRLQARGLTVMRQPEARTLFLGMNQRDAALIDSDLKDRNPFKDARVRRAIGLGVDPAVLQRTLMRGAASVTALMVSPLVRGAPLALEGRAPPDPAAAKALLAQAGYPQGFRITLDCPNDRYVNDEALCVAIAAQLARIGVQVRVRAESKTLWLPRLMRHETDFYLLGWSPATFDALDPIENLLASNGGYNFGGYANPAIDALIPRIETALDERSRDALILEAYRLHQQDVGHVPLHQQAVVWAANARVGIVQRADDALVFAQAQLRR